MRKLINCGIIISLLFCVNAVDAKSKKTQSKKIVTENGSTVDMKRQHQVNDNGDERARRGFRVTDPDGNVVKKGRDRGRNNADGKKARAQQRVTYDENGNKVEKRRRARMDAEGNKQLQRGKKVTDADGNVIARGRDRGYKKADGTERREQQRQYINSKGQRITKKRVKVKN